MLLNPYDSVMWKIHARVILNTLDRNSRGWRSELAHNRAVINAFYRKRPPRTGWIYASAFFAYEPVSIGGSGQELRWG